MLRWLDGWRSCNQVQILVWDLEMAGYFMSSNFHLLNLFPVTPVTLMLRESCVVDASMSQLGKFPQLQKSSDGPLGTPRRVLTQEEPDLCVPHTI